MIVKTGCETDGSCYSTTEDFLLILSTFRSPSCGQAVSAAAADCDSYVVIWGDIGARIWERKDHLLTLIILFVCPDPSLNGGARLFLS